MTRTAVTATSTASSFGSPSSWIAEMVPSMCTGHSATDVGSTVSDPYAVSPACAYLSATCTYPRSAFAADIAALPVVSASRSTWVTRSTLGRLRTISGRSLRLRAVCDEAPIPRTAVRPNQNTDDIGIRFVLPSSLSVESTTTGVPK